MNAPTARPRREVKVQVPGAAEAPVDQAGQADAAGGISAELRDYLADPVGSDEQPPRAAMGRSSYRNMRADDIDASTLTAPVMTLDGWLCPVAAPSPKQK